MKDISDFGDRLQYLFGRIDGALSQRLDNELRPYALTQSQLSALAHSTSPAPARARAPR